MQLKSVGTVVGALLGGAIGLAGCANPPPGTANADATANVAAGQTLGPFDGTYSGPMRILPNSNSACFPPATATVKIVGGKLEYRHFGVNAIVNTTVGLDGVFSGTGYNQISTTRQNLAGTVTANQIEADTNNNVCFYHLSLKRL
jgi:outer membrane murein-binding lipoprotein Lpp